MRNLIFSLFSPKRTELPGCGTLGCSDASGAEFLNIGNIDDLSEDDIARELENGARFVRFRYTSSLLVVSRRSFSPVYLIRPHSPAIFKGFTYSLASLVAGWWALPFGPFFTISDLVRNFRGLDCTPEVVNQLIRLNGGYVYEDAPNVELDALAARPHPLD